MTRALALLPLLTLTACAIDPWAGGVAPRLQTLSALFTALVLPCGGVIGMGLALWADPEASGEPVSRTLPVIVGPALMVVVLLILARAA